MPTQTMTDTATGQTFDAERAAAYDDKIRWLAPGYETLQRAVGSVMESSLGEKAHVLVVGAGTGAEILELGRRNPGWTFTAVDPSPEMLRRCETAVADAGMDARVSCECCSIQAFTADCRYDAATSIFVAHFLPNRAEKHRYFGAIARHLPPGAPLVLADLFAGPSDAADERLRAAWRTHLARHAESTDEVERTVDRIRDQISFVREAELEQILNASGFSGCTRFYQCYLWGAWVAEAAADEKGGSAR